MGSNWVRTLGVAGTALAVGLVSACGASEKGAGNGDGTGSGGETAAAKALSSVELVVPNSTGSGYDTTGRAVVKAMEEAGIIKSSKVENVSGAGGTVGLQKVVNMKGKGEVLLQMGLGVVGATYTNKSKATLADTTPIAKLIEESQAIVVPANSEYKTLADLTAAWKADPGKVPVGGGSSPGGPDHLTPMLLAKAVGVDPKNVNYISYDGGGELLTALLGSKIKFAATGVGEVEEQAKAGKVKILAVTSADKVEGVDAPTLKESGVDMAFTNWRGLVAPGGLSAGDKQALVDAVTKMHDSAQWKAELEKRGWTDAFVAGDAFQTFLTTESQRVAGVLGELGLA